MQDRGWYDYAPLDEPRPSLNDQPPPVTESELRELEAHDAEYRELRETERALARCRKRNAARD